MVGLEGFNKKMQDVHLLAFSERTASNETNQGQGGSRRVRNVERRSTVQRVPLWTKRCRDKAEGQILGLGMLAFENVFVDED